MSNTPETEVLRISGNVTVPKRANNLAHLFEKFLKDWGYTWSGSIVPQDSPTGMRLYRVEEVERLKTINEGYDLVIQEFQDKNAANNKLTLSLSEELKATNLSLGMYKHALSESQKESRQQIFTMTQENTALNKRLELAENTLATKVLWASYGVIGGGITLTIIQYLMTL
jgi:DNA-binding transcriptional MerR regulator